VHPQPIDYGSTLPPARALWKQLLFPAIVTVCHLIGSLWFYRGAYFDWLGAYIGVAPFGPDPHVTLFVQIHEFPCFWLDRLFNLPLFVPGWSFLVIAAVNAILWGLAAFILWKALDKSCPPVRKLIVG
jgi:hypothetical protein